MTETQKIAIDSALAKYLQSIENKGFLNPNSVTHALMDLCEEISEIHTFEIVKYVYSLPGGKNASKQCLNTVNLFSVAYVTWYAHRLYHKGVDNQIADLGDLLMAADVLSSNYS